MKTPKIIVHCLVKNEERFVWYSINSVLSFVDKLIIWDTGSTDNTIKIIETIKSKKIDFKKLNSISAEEFPKIRQKMLDQTPAEYNWIMILDGDEIWPQASIKKITNFCRQNPQYESVFVRTNNLVGDIYHRLPDSAGKYNIAGHKGHLSIRFMNRKNIKGLKACGEHGVQGYFDQDNVLIQNRDQSKIKFLNIFYHHATHLLRTSSSQNNQNVPKRSFKYKYSVGLPIPKNKIPKAFFQTHPQIVPDVTAKAPISFWIKSFFSLPLKLINRVINLGKIGY
jgi:glycosyltransferase involved in cell wall biosynthesis